MESFILYLETRVSSETMFSRLSPKSCCVHLIQTIIYFKAHLYCLFALLTPKRFLGTL